MASTAVSAPVPEEKPPSVQEMSIRLAKKSRKRYNMMGFHEAQKVDFKNWRWAHMHRENNAREGGSSSRPGEDEEPRFGAGSEYGRDAREEARRRRLGFRATSKYQADNQPWMLEAKAYDPDKKKDTLKKFKGSRKGGVGDNTAYYVFVQTVDGAIEAHPLQEWYTFHPDQRFKALSAEEAEVQYENRDKAMNYYALMMRKRLRDDEEADAEAAAAEAALKSKRKGGKSGDKDQLKISEVDEWMNSDDDSDSADGSDAEKKKKSDDEDDKKKKKKVDLKKKKKKKKNESILEAFEDSDDGDEEGRECDYIMSDSSASDSELEQQKEIKSVAEEKGLRKLLHSDEEDDSDDSDEDADDKDKKDEEDSADDKEKRDKKSPSKSSGSKKTAVGATSAKPNNKASDRKKEPEKNAVSSGSNTPSELDFSTDQDSRDSVKNNNVQSRKRPVAADAPDAAAVLSKRVKVETSPGNAVAHRPGASNDSSGITDEAVRRYLLRKPMTAIDLLKKFKSKKTGLSKEELGHILMLALTKVKPIKQKVNGVTYYSLKP